MAVVDTRTQLAKVRIVDDAAGYNKRLHLLAEQGDSPENLRSGAIETSHGLLVAALRTGSRQVFTITDVPS